MRKIAAFVLAGTLVIPVALAAVPQTTQPQSQNQTTTKKHHNKQAARKHHKKSSTAKKA